MAVRFLKAANFGKSDERGLLMSKPDFAQSLTHNSDTSKDDSKSPIGSSDMPPRYHFLVSAIAFAGFNPMGHAFEQLRIYGSDKAGRGMPINVGSAAFVWLRRHRYCAAHPA